MFSDKFLMSDILATNLMLTGCKPVTRKSSIGMLYVCAGGLYVRAGGACHSNLTKIPLTCSVSCFNLVGLGALFGGAKPTKAPRGDGSDWLTGLFLFSTFPLILGRK